MPGYGKRIGKLVRTPEGELMELKAEYKRHKSLYAEHIGELVKCLFRHYIAFPDKETEKLLVMHMGGEFFSKLSAAQQSGGWVCTKCKTANRDGQDLCGFCDTPRFGG